jgi:hypothetical protein
VTGARPDWGFVALGLAVIAVLVANVVDIQRTATAINGESVTLGKTIAASRKAETQFYALARGTKMLADKGNANAAAVASVLQQNGISVDMAVPGK